MKINLISGESYLLVNEKINDILGLSKNVTTFDLAQSTLEDVLIEAGYVSMFEEEKFIVIKNANFFGTDKIKDSDTDILLNYFEHPSDNTNLIFICSTKLDLRKKITKIVKDRFNLINIPNLKYYEIENRAMEAFKKNGFKVEADTVKYLVQNSLNNFDLTMNEVEKIMLFYNESDYVKYEDVVNIAAKSINTNNFLFVDAVVEGDLEKSFELLNDLKIMKVEPTIVLSLLARDFRIMLQIKTLQKEEKREYEILSKLGLQDWHLIKIADMDLNIKTGKVDKYTALELFILDICE